MDSYNLQIGISIQRVCKFGGIYDVTGKFALDFTEYKVMLMLLVHPTSDLKTYKMFKLFPIRDKTLLRLCCKRSKLARMY